MENDNIDTKNFFEKAKDLILAKKKYLIGFILATFLSGYLNLNTNYFDVFIKLIFSVSVIYLFGVLWLGYLIGWDKPILEIGVMPFLLAELFKILILTLLSKKIYKLRKII